jgi:hypothetical protein
VNRTWAAPGFDYASVATSALGTAKTNDNALAAKPDATAARMRISGTGFQFDIRQSAPSAAWAPSTDSGYTNLSSLDLVLAQTGASIITSDLPFQLQTTKAGYSEFTARAT